MEKKVYEKPLMDVIKIDGDVITASGCTQDYPVETAPPMMR